jgi:hypothetical protein
MEKEPRKATDVLLDLESKIETLLGMIRSQDLNIKLLSNKLNLVMDKLEKQNVPSNKIIVEAVNTVTPTIGEEKRIPVSSENALPMEASPQGFRRTSRPETFSGDNAYFKKSNIPDNVVFPIQLPKMSAGKEEAEVVVPDMATNQSIAQPEVKSKVTKQSSAQQHIPVVQRIVDKNGKSIFLAEVDVHNLDNGEEVTKTRTNGTGKWTATLPIGNYKITLRKRESLTKEKIESVQQIQVDGTSVPLELQTMILKI